MNGDLKICFTGWRLCRGPGQCACVRASEVSGLAPDRRGGFTLVEVIAVIAIVSTIAALTFPSFIKQTDATLRVRESANLVAMRDALLLNAIRTTGITDHTGWQQAAANWSGLPVSQVVTNARRYKRVYFLQTAPSPSLIYTQTTNGTSRPAGLRAVLISIIGGDPLTVANCPNPDGGYLSDTDFDALWNLPERGRPTTGNWVNWKGTGDDFLAQRINYVPLFDHLVLVNRDAVTPGFTINGSSPVAVPNIPNNNVGWDAYYLRGSVVGLCDTNGTPLTRHVLTEDVGFVFEEGLWRAQIMGLNTGNTQADDFGNKAAAFLAADWYSGAFKGADQQSALVAMYSFMYTYTLWANQSPHFPAHSIPSQEQVPEYMLLQSAAGDASNDGLDQITGTGGLLK